MFSGTAAVLAATTAAARRYKMARENLPTSRRVLKRKFPLDL
jgi:hypothetical protein